MAASVESSVSPMVMDFIHSPEHDDDLDEEAIRIYDALLTSSDNPVSKAVVSRDVTALKEALANPDNIKYLNTQGGWPPLHTACENGDLDCVKVLLDHEEVDYTVHDNLGLTPVHIACSIGNLEILECIIEAFERFDDASYEQLIHMRGSCGETPLHLAASGYNPKVIVPYLLEHKACAIVVDEDNLYPSYYCHNTQVRKMLLEKENEQSKEMEEEEDIESIAEDLSKM